MAEVSRRRHLREVSPPVAAVQGPAGAAAGERTMIRLILREMILEAAYFLLIPAIMAALIPFAY